MEVSNNIQFGGGATNDLAQSLPGGEELGQEVFMQLLTTQLQNQDPLNPASDVEFIQQMTQFASLEQQRLTNQNLNLIQLYQHSLNNSNSLNIIGKDVKIQTNTINHDENERHTFFYEGSQSAAEVKVSITDENGRIVYTESLPSQGDGEFEYEWDGIKSDGSTAPKGKYKIDIQLVDAEGEQYSTPVHQNIHIDGITYENNSIYLLADGHKLPLDAVVEVYESNAVSSGDISVPGLKNKVSTILPFETALRRY